MKRAAVALATITLAAGICTTAPAAAAPHPAAGPVAGVADKTDVWYWKLMGTYSLLSDCQSAGVAKTSSGEWDSYSCEPKSSYYLLFAGFND